MNLVAIANCPAQNVSPVLSAIGTQILSSLTVQNNSRQDRENLTKLAIFTIIHSIAFIYTGFITREM